MTRPPIFFRRQKSTTGTIQQPEEFGGLAGTHSAYVYAIRVRVHVSTLRIPPRYISDISNDPNASFVLCYLCTFFIHTSVSPRYERIVCFFENENWFSSYRLGEIKNTNRTLFLPLPECVYEYKNKLASETFPKG